MAKFNDLPNDQKVNQIKDRYVKIIENIARDPKNLTKYIEMPKSPVLVEPKIINIVSTMSEPERKIAAETNHKTRATADAENAKEQAAFDEKQKSQQKLLEIFAGLKPNEYCICEPKEIDLGNVLNSVIPEFDIFIDIARKEAEAATY
jgi:DNA replication protein DnaD